MLIVIVGSKGYPNSWKKSKKHEQREICYDAVSELEQKLESVQWSLFESKKSSQGDSYV